MKLLDFIDTCDLKTQGETERLGCFVFYSYKEQSKVAFIMTQIGSLFSDSSFSMPNPSRLKKNLIQERSMKETADKNALEFTPAALQRYEQEYQKLWEDYKTIISDSDLLDETIFCGKRDYLTKIVKQINNTYKNNCFDACAVLMRRLFEILLILSYEHNQKEYEIKDTDGNYCMLDKIIGIVIGKNSLTLSRIKNKFDTFRKVGNFSAHGLTYCASKKDIDDIKLNYRVMLQELYEKAGLSNNGDETNGK